ncbi:caffeine-induced death protein 2-domain-containing protein [Coprinopsis sp. MPI-PUGE-AT-0042]|nr:caffeine-induced death protein 2-domain-containing protein [Coprinopsis sp. MPI-PUGE-AT-0042]
MPTRNPQLGSLALQGPSAETQTIRVTAATCQDLSLFKSILKEYRRLDDGITMRLNRANALTRDEERERGGTGIESVQNQACAAVLKELLDNWKRRTQLINYCVSIHDENLVTNKKTEREAVSPSDQRKAQAAAFSDEVKGNQIRNEKTVEKIIRKRAVDAFNSRCQYFSRPLQEDVQPDSS